MRFRIPHLPVGKDDALRVRGLLLPILAGLGAGLVFWILAAVAEVFIIHERSLFGELFQPLPAHLLIRLIAIFGCVIFSVMYALLRRSERKLRLTQFVVENSADSIFWADAGGRIKYVNAAVMERYGYTRAELLRMTVGDMDPLFPPEAWKPHVEELKQKGRLRFESVHSTKSGERFPVEITSTCVSGEGIELICGNIRDITERKRTEQELRLSQQRLVRAEILAHMGDWERDLSTNALVWSDEMYRLVGFEPGDPKGTYVNFLAMVHPEDRELVKKLADDAVNEGKPYAVQYRLHREKDGADLVIRATADVVRDPQGKPLQLIGTAQDITELIVAEEALREAKEAAEKANRTKDLFLATLSHELRTPLTAILSWAQLLKSGIIDPSKTRTGLQAIEDGALSQNQLISDLLDISRISAGKISLEIQNVELMDTVRKAIDTVRGMAEKRSIHIIEHLGAVPLFVSGDAGRLEQIVWNLLSNSIKFTPPGGSVEITLEVCEKPSGPKAQLRVRDTGKGISVDFLPHIFEQFSQADSSSVRAHGGLGIGLALVHRLVKLQGGTVAAQSEGDGKGATFTVTFRLGSASRFAEGGYETPARGRVTPEKSLDRLDLSGIRVLFVDDEAGTLESIKETLSFFGAQVRVASTVSEAIAEFEKSTPDVLVSDIAMPVEDGYSLIRKIRKRSHENGGDTPAVALTAYADSQSRELALSAGYQAHLAKPVDSADLVRTILSATSV